MTAGRPATGTGRCDRCPDRGRRGRAALDRRARPRAWSARRSSRVGSGSRGTSRTSPATPSARPAWSCFPGGAYCGLAPVPGGRINVGIVLAGRAWRERLQTDGAAAVGQAVLEAIPPIDGDPEAWRDGRDHRRDRGREPARQPGGAPRRARLARRRRRGRVPRPVHRRGTPPGARQRPAGRGGDRRGAAGGGAGRRPRGYDRAMDGGSAPRTSSRWSSRRSSRGPRCSTTRAGASRAATTSVRRWAS